MNNLHFIEILKKSFFSLITKIFGITLNYFLIYLIAKDLGILSLGTYSIAITTLLILVIIFTIGLNFSITRLIAEVSSLKIHISYIFKKTFLIIFIFTLFGSIFLFLFSKTIAITILKNSEFNKIIKLISVFAPFYVFTIFNIEFLKSIKKIKISETIRNVGFPLFTIILIFTLKIEENKAIYAYGISTFVLFFISSFFIYLKIFKSKKLENSSKQISIKSILNPSFHLMVVGIASFFLSEFGVYALEFYHTTEAVGNYTIAYKISLFASIIFITSASILGPKIAELFWNNNKKELYTICLSISKITFIISLPISIVLLLFSDFFLNLFNPSIYLNTILLVLVIGQFLYAITGVAGVYLMVSDKQKVFRNIYIISAIINIILCKILIPKYSVLGAAIATSTSHVFLNLLCIIYIYKEKLL